MASTTITGATAITPPMKRDQSAQYPQDDRLATGSHFRVK